MRRALEWFTDPHHMVIFHRSATTVWLILAIPTVLVWKESITWVALMSVWANVAGHWGSLQASLAQLEVRTEEGTDDGGQPGGDRRDVGPADA